MLGVWSGGSGSLQCSDVYTHFAPGRRERAQARSRGLECASAVSKVADDAILASANSVSGPLEQQDNRASGAAGVLLFLLLLLLLLLLLFNSESVVSGGVLAGTQIPGGGGRGRGAHRYINSEHWFNYDVARVQELCESGRKAILNRASALVTMCP